MRLLRRLPSNLVLDMVGQACQVGNSSVQLMFTGSYVIDSSSSGTVANTDAIGGVNINSPLGLPGTGTTMKASLVGQLSYGNWARTGRLGVRRGASHR